MSNQFSIIIPSWNNLPYLQKCIKGIKYNSSAQHEIIVHVNEGADGTVEWLEEQGVKYTKSEKNIGICEAVNHAFQLSTMAFIMYMNDDMWPLPDWDKPLINIIENISEEDHFMLSSTMIEPRYSKNSVVIHGDYGDNLKDFRQQDLVQSHLQRNDWNGASWPPVLLKRISWEEVGGFSEEFSPGMYSDPDLSMKLWQLGCRYYQGVGDSLVYHFQRKSTGRIEKNDGRKQFLRKWGILPSHFYKYYLKMGKPFQGRLSTPKRNIAYFISYMKSRLLKLRM